VGGDGGATASRSSDPSVATWDAAAGRAGGGVGASGSARPDFIVAAEGSTGVPAGDAAPNGTPSSVSPPLDDAGVSTPDSKADRGGTGYLVRARTRPTIATRTITAIFPRSRMSLVLCPAQGPRQTWGTCVAVRKGTIPGCCREAGRRHRDGAHWLPALWKLEARCDRTTVSGSVARAALGAGPGPAGGAIEVVGITAVPVTGPSSSPATLASIGDRRHRRTAS